MIQEYIASAVVWLRVYFVPSANVVSLILQLLNLLVLIRGTRSERLHDPVYLLWMAYGVADVCSNAIWAINIFLNFDSDVQKWLAWLDWSLGWFPSLYMQLALAVYYVIVLTFPIWYYQNKDSATLKWISRGMILAVFALSQIITMPLTLPGYTICYCPEGFVVSPKMMKIYPLYSIAEKVALVLTFLCYLFLSIKSSCVQNKKKRTRRMLVIAFTSWFVTMSLLILNDLVLLMEQGSLSYVTTYLVSTLMFVAHISINPIIQVVRNTKYRNEAKMLFGMKETSGGGTKAQMSTRE